MRGFTRSGKASAVFVFLASPIFGPPLSAQTETELGSRISHPSPAEIPLRGLSSADKAQATILAFSACVVSRSRSAVEHALALPADNKTYSRALSNLATSDCLRYGELQMQPELMRGGLFNALYRADFMKTSPPLYGKQISYESDVGDVNLQSSKSYIALREFADCVVRADPVDSRAIVLSAVSSTQEKTAYSDISPSLGGCITAGEKLTFSKTVITGLLSEALYRQTSMR